MTVDEKDLRVDVYRGGGVTMRVTHMPSGIVVQRHEGSLYRMKQECIAEIEAQLTKREAL